MNEVEMKANENQTLGQQVRGNSEASALFHSLFSLPYHLLE